MKIYGYEELKMDLFSKLIVYRDFGVEGDLLKDISDLIAHYMDEDANDVINSKRFYNIIHELLENAANHGFSGNIYHCYLANLLVNNENAYSKACEIRGAIEGTINEAVLHDIKIFKELFDYDFSNMSKKLNVEGFELVMDYTASSEESKVYNSRIRKRICDLACAFAKDDTPDETKDTLTNFYKDYGVGKFGLHKAFRIEHDEEGTKIVPILNIAHVKLDDLVGYDIPKGKLIANTEAFIKRRQANNCLLYGDAGTGKSSSIKAIANEYYEDGLRIIEVYKHQFQYLNDVISQIKNRNYRFVIYMDDLSFEDFEIEYKYLKAVIEGGLEKKPENILIYATSNRRHLVRERFTDKEDRDDDLHTNDTVEEKLSLASRFGVSIYFGSPSKKEFQNIVRVLAERKNIKMDDDKLMLEANKWELAHHGYSGRCAQQFIDYLMGMES